MDLGPILETRQREKITTVIFEGVTAYDRENYTDYYFHGDLAVERAKLFEAEYKAEYKAEYGAEYKPKADGTPIVKIKRPKS